MLTYGLLGNISGVHPDSEYLIRAISILVSRFSVLKLHFTFVDDEGITFYLDDDEAQEFLKFGELHHPSTGVLVENPKEKLFPYFEGDRELVAGGHDQ